MRHAFMLVLFCLIAATCLAGQERTVATYKKHIQSAEHRAGDFDHNLHHMLYLTGIGDTYLFLNNQKETFGDKVLYCQPKDTKLTGQDYKSIFENYIHEHEAPEFDSLTIPAALLMALEEKFPCP